MSGTDVCMHFLSKRWRRGKEGKEIDQHTNTIDGDPSSKPFVNMCNHTSSDFSVGGRIETESTKITDQQTKLNQNRER